MNGLFDNRNMAIVYHECIWAFSIFSLFLLVSFRVLFHERNQVGDKNPDLFSCRTTGRRVAVNGGGHKSDGTIVCPLFEVSCRSGRSCHCSRHEWPAGREHFPLRCMPPGFVGGGTTLWQADEGLVVRHERGCGGRECRITVAALFWGERSEIKKKSAIVNNGRSSFFIFGYCLSGIRFLTKPLSLRSFLLLLFRQPAVRRGSLLWNGLRNRT